MSSFGTRHGVICRGRIGHSNDRFSMFVECSCGFTCGTQAAFDRHLRAQRSPSRHQPSTSDQQGISGAQPTQKADIPGQRSNWESSLLIHKNNLVKNVVNSKSSRMEREWEWEREWKQEWEKEWEKEWEQERDQEEEWEQDWDLERVAAEGSRNATVGRIPIACDSILIEELVYNTHKRHQKINSLKSVMSKGEPTAVPSISAFQQFPQDAHNQRHMLKNRNIWLTPQRASF